MFAGTFIAVVLGVAFLGGALALGDTLRENFNTLFSNADIGTAAVIRSSTSVGSGVAAPRTLIPASLLRPVGKVAGVEDAQPSVSGFGQIIGSNGKAIGGNGPPRVAENWITNPALNPYHLVAGRAPAADDEVVINQGAATTGRLRVGDWTTVQTPQSVRVRIVGLADYGTATGSGNSTFTAFTLPGVQRYVTHRPGQISEILIQAKPSRSEDEVVASINAILPPGIQAVSGSAVIQEDINDLNSEFLNFLNAFLLIFAGIALLVAVLSIANTFSILVAQQSRESALLRAIGSTRRQVLASVAIEAACVGITASAVGMVAGLGLAGLLKGVFDSFGFALPAGGLDVTGRTVAISIVVGSVATLIAALAPAQRASRVPPLAALRQSASGDGVNLSRSRMWIGVGLLVVGTAVLIYGAGGNVKGPFAFVGIGSFCLTAGFVFVGPLASKAGVAVIGAPIARFRGVPGSLSRANAGRSPRRTASAASALMIGIGVVTLFTVLGSSLSSSVTENVTNSLRADVAITTGSYGGGGLAPQLAADMGALPGIAVATGIGEGGASIDGKGEAIAAVDPTKVDSVLDLHPVDGSMRTLAMGQIAVSEHVAHSQNWHLGTALNVVFPDGTAATQMIGVIFTSRDIVGDYVLPNSIWYPHAVQTLDKEIFGTLAPGAQPAAVEASVRRLAAANGHPTVQDRSQYIAAASQSVSVILGIVYVLLVLAVIIAIFGIANMLSLSVYERTPELRLLRAVGETRRQLRSMIRLESLIVAVLGTLAGLLLGGLIGWGIAEATNNVQGIATFTLDPLQLILILILGSIAGLLAAIRPARRAARLPVLEAIADD